MRLTWKKDGVATLLVAAIAAVYVAYLAQADLPLVHSARWTAAITLVLGALACGSASRPEPGRPTTLANAVGGLAGVLAIAAMITGNPVVLAVLIGCVGLLWAGATAHHAGLRLPGGHTGAHHGHA